MFRKLDFGELLPGMGFGYSGPRRLTNIRGGIAIGQILAIDSNAGVIHVRTFGPSAGSEDLRPEIGLLPIVGSAFRKSLRFLHSKGPVPEDCWPALLAWRERHRAGEVGAFNVALWLAEETAWETVRDGAPDASAETMYIEYVFPKLEPVSNTFKITEVSCYPRVTNGIA